MKILAQRPTHISDVATVLLDRQTDRQTDRQRQTETETEGGREGIEKRGEVEDGVKSGGTRRQEAD